MQHRRSYPVRDKIMRRYDQELLGAPLWCMTQQEEGLWIQEVNAMVLQRRVFVCASELALDESLSHQHMGAVYHQGRSPSASTSMIGEAGELDCFIAHIRLREPDKSEDKVEYFSSSKGSVRTNKNQHNSANPTPESIIGELKQHGGSEFNYSTTATESG
ncbi:hypothetical protein BHM03_00044462 [Ensete ventricosum]|nr:hypothetical protein BHM03_00044462 [Ensete ventricosum]